MRKKLDSAEAKLIGQWNEKNGSVEQDAVCERIQWLTDFYLEQIAVNGANWSALYRNSEDVSFWELTYPKSYLQGGGPPTLQRISAAEAYERYQIKSEGKWNKRE